MLAITLADQAGLRWAQEQVTRHHYLHTPVDVRCRPLAYLVQLFGEPVGCLIFGRPQATRVTGWYGSLQEVETRRCPLTRWQVLNLARVYLAPCIQKEGTWDHAQGTIGPSVLPGFSDRQGVWRSRAASFVLDLALERVAYDYLWMHPPVWMEQPYELAQVLSYCDTRRHTGALYRAARFEPVRTNRTGLVTYRRPLRPLTPEEHAQLAQRSRHDPRARRLREAARQCEIRQANWEALLSAEDPNDPCPHLRKEVAHGTQS